MTIEGGDQPCWAEQVCDRCGSLVNGGVEHACHEVALTPKPGVTRTITGFHQDLSGYWAADLSCLHSQHVRHDPPFRLREWVLSDEGRAAHTGTDIDCPLCARAELPGGLSVLRTAGPFDASSVPPGLLRHHLVAEGRWACLQVLEGVVVLTLDGAPPASIRLHAGDRQAIPPGITHAVSLEGAVRFTIDFLGRRQPEPGPAQAQGLTTGPTPLPL